MKRNPRCATSPTSRAQILNYSAIGFLNEETEHRNIFSQCIIE